MLAKKPLFSIIIPTLNEEHYLPYLLTDLAKQQRKNFEVIVVDGSSTDRTKEFALRFDSFFPLRIINSKKRNVSYQRNSGVIHARGKYLVFLDADSRIFTLFIKRLDMYATKRRKSLFLPTLQAEKSEHNGQILYSLMGLNNKIIALSHKLGKPLAPGGNVIIRKKIFIEVAGFDETLFMGEDHNLVQKVFQKGIKPIILKDVKVVYSLRRADKEGQLLFLYKLLFSFLHVLVNGGVKGQIFPYEMGGHPYHQKQIPMMRFTLQESFKTQHRQIRRMMHRVSSLLN